MKLSEFVVLCCFASPLGVVGAYSLKLIIDSAYLY